MIIFFKAKETEMYFLETVYKVGTLAVLLMTLVMSILDKVYDHHYYKIKEEQRKSKRVYFFDAIRKKYMGIDTSGVFYTYRVAEATPFYRKIDDSNQKYYVNVAFPTFQLRLDKHTGIVEIEKKEQTKSLNKERFFITKNVNTATDVEDIIETEVNNRKKDNKRKYTYPCSNNARYGLY